MLIKNKIFKNTNKILINKIKHNKVKINLRLDNLFKIISLWIWAGVHNIKL